MSQLLVLEGSLTGVVSLRATLPLESGLYDAQLRDTLFVPSGTRDTV